MTQDTEQRPTNQSAQHRKLKSKATRTPPNTTTQKTKKTKQHGPHQIPQHRKLKSKATRTPPNTTTQKAKKQSNTDPTKYHNTEN